MKFNFVKSRKIFFAISIVMVVATVVSLFTLGFNWDIEFVGGTELTFKLDTNATKDDEKKIEDAVVSVIGKDSFSSIRVAEGNEVVVRTTLVDKDVNYDELNSAIDGKVKTLYPDATLVSADDMSVVYTIVTEEEVAPEQETDTDSLPDNVDDETAQLDEANDAQAQDVATDEASDENAEIADEENEAEPEEETADVATEITNALNDGTVGIQKVNVEKNTDGNYVIEYNPVSEVNALRSEMEEAVNELYPLAEDSEETTRLTGMTTVSAEVSDSLKKTAFLATFIAIALMLLYIAFRFEGRAAFAAIICLAHDVIMMLFAYSVFQIPVSSTIIAAILTILGYSINATIVIFDRIRENNKNMSSSVSFEDKVDSGIKSTIWRSLNTTITTLLTIGLIYILGVTSIKNFALPLIVGIVSGVYSSICLSGNLWVVLKKIGKKSK